MNANMISRINTSAVLLTIFVVGLAQCHYLSANEQQFPSRRIVRVSQLVARRSADESRPITRVILQPSSPQHSSSLSTAESSPVEAPIVMGRFRAPAPERMTRTRIPKNANHGQHTVGASFQVGDLNEQTDSNRPEAAVAHGTIAGNGSGSNKRNYVERQVGAKMQVSDEGLNYPPSKLSADIYGNVAEIVTAPPEAVDSDLLVPVSNRYSSGGPSSTSSRQQMSG